MFGSDPGWEGLVVALATLATRTYLRRVRMAEKPYTERDVQSVRAALWAHGEYLVEHLLEHEHLEVCEVSSQLRLVGWTPEAFIVAVSFDCRELLDD